MHRSHLLPLILQLRLHVRTSLLELGGLALLCLQEVLHVLELLLKLFDLCLAGVLLAHDELQISGCAVLGFLRP